MNLVASSELGTWRTSVPSMDQLMYVGVHSMT